MDQSEFEDIFSLLSLSFNRFMNLSRQKSWPSEKLKNGLKPSIKVLRYSNLSNDELDALVLQKWEDHKLDVSLALDFLWRNIDDLFQAQIDHNWVSFGIEIAQSGDIVHPSNLINLEVEDGSYQGHFMHTKMERGKGRLLDQSQRATLVGLIISLYSISKSRLKGHLHGAEMLKNKASDIFSKSPWNPGNLLTSFESQNTHRFGLDCHFKATVAVVDMFMAKFADHMYSDIRQATKNTAYEGCVMVEMISHFAKILGRDKFQALEFLFIRPAHQEVKKIISHQEEDELDKSDSYTIYMCSMNIVNESPLSANESVSAYTMMNMICALMGSDRSLNAKVLRGASLSLLTKTSIFIAGCLLSIPQPVSKKFDKQTAKDNSKINLLKIETDEKNDYLTLSKSVTPNDIIRLGKMCDFNPPVTFEFAFAEMLKKKKKLKPGSIGFYLKNELK